ncbi:MAG: hypothetical protein LC754_15695 [Acidobacteria bacterium]|nr:hypothetical protein [Acidobacteriota bacterium]
MRLVFLILLSLPFIVNGQSSSVRGLEPAAENRVQGILKGLESDNTLRFSLERGDRGEGIYHAWMGKMRQLGIKQASFVIGFKWKGGVEGLKIKNISLLRQYYRYDTQIKDRNLLRLVRDIGLEQELREAILIRARAAVPQIMKNVSQTANVNPHRAHGTLYLNLLDDEALPILDEMPHVEW